MLDKREVSLAPFDKNIWHQCHFTKASFDASVILHKKNITWHKCHLTKMSVSPVPFDKTTFDTSVIWQKQYLTPVSFDKTTFDTSVIWQKLWQKTKIIWQKNKSHLTKDKSHLTKDKSHLTKDKSQILEQACHAPKAQN